MTDRDPIRRRTYLGLLSLGGLAATAGCTGILGDEDGAEDGSPDADESGRRTTERDDTGTAATGTPGEGTDGEPGSRSRTTEEGTPESGVQVETVNAELVANDRAEVTGSVSFAAADSTAAYFEYRETGSEEWSATGTREVTEEGAVTGELTDLTARTDYEFRFVAEVGDARSEGDSGSFSTRPYEPPEPRFVVAEDGSGDYETLEDAQRVASDEDVIGLREGEYSITLEKYLHVVGVDETRPTVTFEPNGNGYHVPRHLDRGFVSEDLAHHLSLYDVAVETADGDPLRSGAEDTATDTWDVRLYGVDWSVPIPAAGGEEEHDYEVTAEYSTFREAIDTAGLSAVGSTFEGDVVAESAELEHVTIGEGIAFETDDLTATDCRFATHVADVDGSATGTTFERGLSVSEFAFEDCRILGLELTPNAVHAVQGESRVTCEDCTIAPGPNLDVSIHVPAANPDSRYDSISVPEVRNSTLGAEGSAVAVRIVAPDGWKSTPSGPYANGGFYDCTVTGVVELENPATVEFVGNVFQSPQGNDFFVDGSVYSIVRNSFRDGGDVRIASGQTRMYDGNAEVGNYYSAWEDSDGKEDGILDLPRPIPGEGEVTDEHPLANPDPDAYRL